MKRFASIALAVGILAAGAIPAQAAGPVTEGPIAWSKNAPVLVRGSRGRAICGSTRGAFTLLSSVRGTGPLRDRMSCAMTAGTKVTVPDGVTELYVRTWGSWNGAATCDLPAGTAAGVSFFAAMELTIEAKPSGGIAETLAHAASSVGCTGNGTDPVTTTSVSLFMLSAAFPECDTLAVIPGQTIRFRVRASVDLDGDDTGGADQVATANVTLNRLRGTWSSSNPCN